MGVNRGGEKNEVGEGVTSKKMNGLISINPALSVGVLSNVFLTILTSFQFIVWWFAVMVFGSIVLSSNPLEKLWRYIHFTKSLTERVIGFMVMVSIYH